jgi:FtsP/CotA-like multicopper oxidase with cupredoxin domain
MLVLPLALAFAAAADTARVVPNDNREPAGRLRAGVLTVRLDVVRAEWRPEADSGPGITVEAFAEAGKPPRIPGPLLRVPTGTTIVATVTNTLPDSTVTVFGLVARPADSTARAGVAIPPGQSREVRFQAGAPGTYLYWGRVGVQSDSVEREQLAGAFVVDSAGGPHRDRVFVMNIWGSPVDSVTFQNALAINGRSFPYNERVQATVGDTLRWRVINATGRGHPMHLHGFYFAIGAVGDPWGDTVYAPADRRMVVTETMRPGQTMDLAWTPDRDGNWLFHCHITFHVAPPFARFTPSASADTGMASETMSHDPRMHMAGLALGITVSPPRGYRAAARERPRALRLLVQEGRPRLHAARALGYVLERGADPARDSVEIPGSVLVLTRGEPTDITVVNRLAEPTGVHWHGIELESYSDGVVGWSGSGDRLAPRIAPGDSFTARLTLPRAGTFMYHTHLNDLVQLTSGLYGAIVVLEPGRTLDPATDHVLVAGWDGAEGTPWIVVNGDSAPPPLTLAAGVTHRFRLVNIGSAGRLGFKLERAGASVTWRRVAKDGADLPPAQVREHAAQERLDVGETMDVVLAAPAPGSYRLTVGYGLAERTWTREVVVR